MCLQNRRFRSKLQTENTNPILGFVRWICIRFAGVVVCVCSLDAECRFVLHSSPPSSAAQFVSVSRLFRWSSSFEVSTIYACFVASIVSFFVSRSSSALMTGAYGLNCKFISSSHRRCRASALSNMTRADKKPCVCRFFFCFCEARARVGGWQ